MPARRAARRRLPPVLDDLPILARIAPTGQSGTRIGVRPHGMDAGPPAIDNGVPLERR
ncbi:hypothetical protein [Micromonospora sp. HK10]|uniref:hypothetical protein n=1 Tax=Micromonospora sp. HK10 TaxID=1538294 RepID=UPI000A91FD69|nr:hypothetical protein [Micromonospora sp. HK10]